MALEIIRLANSLADDQIGDDEVLAFVNDALAEIGRETNASFPVLETKYDEPVIPDKWQRILLVPYAKARIKEKDSSQFEWEAAYSQFYNNLTDFRSSYVIPDAYKDLEGGSSIIVGGENMVVDSGDTLATIAKQNQTTVDALISENPHLKFATSYSESSILTRPGFWQFPW